MSKVGTHCFLENSVSHESKDCVYDPKDMLLLQPLCPLTLHQEERRVGVLGKGLGKSLSTSTGRGSIGEEPPAERYECRGNVALFPGPHLCVFACALKNDS